MERLSKVVVIDDDNIHNFISTKLIEKLNITERLAVFDAPYTALDFIVERCIKKIKGHCPDLVLVDKLMPGLDAVDLLKCLQQKGICFVNDIVVGIMSDSKFLPAEVDEFKKLNVREFIEKPISADHICALMAKYFS